MKIVSWNVNSIRARIIDPETAKCKSKKRSVLKTSPMGKLIQLVKPTIICLQETKCSEKNIGCLDVQGFESYWNCAAKAGYSGVAIWTTITPLKVTSHLPGLKNESKHLEQEGRILTAYFEDFILVNTYSPNTLRGGANIDHRKNWDQAMCKYLVKLKKKYKKVIWCGDMNVALNPLDLYHGVMTMDKLEEALKNPKTPPYRIKELERRVHQAEHNAKYGGGAGYRLSERKSLKKILKKGFVDVYRSLYDDYGFTYWDMRQKAFRGANKGWRIDYFIITSNLQSKVKDIKVYKEIGEKTRPIASDHAPIVLTLK